MVVEVASDMQPADDFTFTLKVPVCLTTIEAVVAPVDQIKVPLPDAVSFTESPWQKVVGPLGVIVGGEGLGFTETTTGAEVAEVQVCAFVVLTVNEPAVFTLMLWVEAPVLQI
jgi:hypothetical protein